MAIAFPSHSGGTLTVRVRGVPFPIEFAHWTKGDLVEQVEKAIREFATKLMTIVREEVVNGVDAMFETHAPSNVPVTPVRHPTIPLNGQVRPKAVAAKPTVLSKPKKTNGAPIQLCPVPGCKERAAPSLGMVCAKHKSVPKAKIAKYREARRKAKAAKAKS